MLPDARKDVNMCQADSCNCVLGWLIISSIVNGLKVAVITFLSKLP